MTNIAIEKVKESGPKSPALSNKLEMLAERIRQRAYDIFEHRAMGREPMEDWLEAERDLVLVPESELIEKDGKYEIRVAAPGFKAQETHVTALPEAVIVSAESSHKHEETNANVHFCEFGGKTLYRRLDLPKPINVDQVTANLEDGVLRITAQRAEAAGGATGKAAA